MLVHFLSSPGFKADDSLLGVGDDKEWSSLSIPLLSSMTAVSLSVVFSSISWMREVDKSISRSVECLIMVHVWVNGPSCEDKEKLCRRFFLM